MKKRRIVVAGAGGFIGGHLVNHLVMRGNIVRAVDKKPLDEWHQVNVDAEWMSLDLSQEQNCRWVCKGMDEVYHLAADMGGMGFIEKNRIACMRSALITMHMLEAAALSDVKKFFYASSACVYNADKQDRTDVTALKESDAYPAMAERGYGWEKLYGEMLCREYYAERHLETYVARFHNVYGPQGTWQGGREKAPAAICRKVAEAVLKPKKSIEIWGDGKQTRSFMWIDDCIQGICRIAQEPRLVATPINLGSSELVSIDTLVDKVEAIAGVKLSRLYDLTAPKGVAGRNSDNSFIQEMLGWEPETPLEDGLRETYRWVKGEILSGMEGGKEIV
jgi:GDP-D-mannose 3', 5'-epimerase